MSEQGHGGVLVVDDEPQVAWVLRFSLEHEGYQTYTASNGIEALEELEKHHPKLMVLDLMMPEMDGWARPPRADEAAGRASGLASSS